MTIEEVKGAMENFSFELQYNEYRYANSEIQAMQTALKVLENELERLENKPLDLEALKNMIGEPVYCVSEDYNEFLVIKSVRDVNTRGAFNCYKDVNFTDGFYCNNDDILSGEVKFYKYKPQEVGNDL